MVTSNKINMRKENLFSKDCIRTFTGEYFNPLNPDISKIRIEDIAHSLSMQCRFGGHLPSFYSVAEHSVLVAAGLPLHLRLAGLLHDASEGLGLLDIPRPIKTHMPEYLGHESKLMQAVYKKYGLDFSLLHSPELKSQDDLLVKLEWNTIFLNQEYIGLEPKKAENLFLGYFAGREDCTHEANGRLKYMKYLNENIQ